MGSDSKGVLYVVQCLSPFDYMPFYGTTAQNLELWLCKVKGYMTIYIVRIF